MGPNASMNRAASAPRKGQRRKVLPKGAAFTIPEFCDAHRISRATFYNMKNRASARRCCACWGVSGSRKKAPPSGGASELRQLQNRPARRCAGSATPKPEGMKADPIPITQVALLPQGARRSSKWRTER